MKPIEVFSFGLIFEFKYFFDVDHDIEGFDVYLDDEHIGEMIISSPDVDDEESMTCFIVEAQNWLEENYWN